MKPKILFVYDMDKDLVPMWKDGLWAALKILKKNFEIRKFNLASVPDSSYDGREAYRLIYDWAEKNSSKIFILGWGAFGSRVDKAVKFIPSVKRGLCIGGNVNPPLEKEKYDVLFYETKWYLPQIQHHPHTVHAFGINSNIYKFDTVSRYAESYPLWNYLTVGAFAYWKRQDLLRQKPGRKMAIGQIQKGNIQESIDIVGNLLLGGVAVSDMVSPEVLAKHYYMTEKVYIPADINGGGERAVLEARACDRKVEVENDNPKLQELLTCPVWEEGYYASQLKGGILKCLR